MNIKLDENLKKLIEEKKQALLALEADDEDKDDEDDDEDEDEDDESSSSDDDKKDDEDDDKKDEDVEVLTVKPIVVEAYKLDPKDLGAMMESSDLNEEAKTKITTIFESAVNAKVNSLVEQINEAADVYFTAQVKETVDGLQEAFAGRIAELDEQADEYLTAVANKWLEENQIALESAMKVQRAESILEGIRVLFSENQILVPEDKIDLVAEMESHIEELTGKLDEAVETNMELRKSVKESQKQIAVGQFVEGMTAVKAGKVRELAETVEFTNPDEFGAKLKTLSENFVDGNKATKSTDLLAEVDTKNVVDTGSGEMDRLVKAMSVINKKPGASV